MDTFCRVSIWKLDIMSKSLAMKYFHLGNYNYKITKLQTTKNKTKLSGIHQEIGESSLAAMVV